MKKHWKKTGIIAAAALLILVSIFTIGCKKGNTKTEKADGTSDFQGEFVISAQEAMDKIGDEDVFFLDARGTKVALTGTVKGAVAVTWPELTLCEEGKAGDDNWGLVPEPDELTRRLQALGIEKEKEIIILGQPEDGWGEDGRILWELRQAGCTNLKIVDGGITAMKDIGAPMKLGAAKPTPSDIAVSELDESHTITTEELQEHYDDYVIVDTRAQEEYDGAILYDEAQGGHLPGAILIPFTELFQKDGTLKPNDEIINMFEEKGVHKTDKVVTYCTGGIRAAYAQLVLEMCGYENTWNYGQSFWRWAVVGEVEK